MAWIGLNLPWWKLLASYSKSIAISDYLFVRWAYMIYIESLDDQRK